jgi:hypothetical protein
MRSLPPKNVNSNSLVLDLESLSGAQYASVLEFDSTWVTVAQQGTGIPTI